MTAIRDEDWLADRRRFLQEVGLCLASGVAGPIEVAHIRFPDAWFGKLDAGMGLKPGHQWTVPLSPEEHRMQHVVGERVFWRERGFDPEAASTSPLAAAAMFTQFHAVGDVDAARQWVQQRWHEANKSRFQRAF